MNNTKQLMITFIAMILIMVIGLGSFGFVCHNALEDNKILTTKLNDNSTILASTKKELTSTQENLRIEAEKSIGLSDQLMTANTKFEKLKTELDTANTTLEALKSEEYELVYMGNFRYTYYCDERYEHICGYGIGKTASGKPTEVGWTVAADTSVLPMGSIIYVEGLGFREVMDRGGGVKGSHIDILLPTHAECFEQPLTKGGVWILVKKTS